MKVTKKSFGMLNDGSKVNLYTISNERMSVCVTDFGCTLTGIFLPNKKGGFDDILLGYSTLDGFVNSPGMSFGSVVGRFANRIENAAFTLDGVSYNLDKNDNAKNTLHGGFFRYDHQMWHSKIVSNKYGVGVKFSRLSPDGEQGFPGNVMLTVTYTLNEQNQLTLKYNAVTDKATPINITNHAYFNLAGSGTVLNHELMLNCEEYLETDDLLIPTGKLLSVKNTAYDFRVKKTLGRDIANTGVGYDDCFVTSAYNGKDSGLPVKGKKLVRAAVLSDSASGRTMTVDTNQEGLQVYTGNFVGGTVGKLGVEYKTHGAVCLETQCFPDTPNKKDFPSCTLEPGQKYKSVTVYGFAF